MWQPILKNELTKVSVDRDQDALVAMGQFQKLAITRIGTKFRRFDDVVAKLSQGDCQTMSRTPVDEKSHECATSTSSSDS